MKKIVVFGIITLAVVIVVVAYLITANNNLDKCSQDSDCILTSGTCGGIIAINVEYKTFLEITDKITDKLYSPCALMGAPICPYHRMGYHCGINEYVAKCVNGTCEAMHITEVSNQSL